MTAARTNMRQTRKRMTLRATLTWSSISFCINQYKEVITKLVDVTSPESVEGRRSLEYDFSHVTQTMSAPIRLLMVWQMPGVRGVCRRESRDPHSQ